MVKVGFASYRLPQALAEQRPYRQLDLVGQEFRTPNISSLPDTLRYRRGSFSPPPSPDIVRHRKHLSEALPLCVVQGPNFFRNSLRRSARSVVRLRYGEVFG